MFFLFSIPLCTEHLGTHPRAWKHASTKGTWKLPTTGISDNSGCKLSGYVPQPVHPSVSWNYGKQTNQCRKKKSKLTKQKNYPSEVERAILEKKSFPVFGKRRTIGAKKNRHQEYIRAFGQKFDRELTQISRPYRAKIFITGIQLLPPDGRSSVTIQMLHIDIYSAVQISTIWWDALLHQSQANRIDFPPCSHPTCVAKLVNGFFTVDKNWVHLLRLTGHSCFHMVAIKWGSKFAKGAPKKRQPKTILVVNFAQKGKASIPNHTTQVYET